MAALSCYQPCRSHLAQPARCLDEEDISSLTFRRHAFIERCRERGARAPEPPAVRRARDDPQPPRRPTVESSWSKVEEVRKKFEGAAAISSASYSRSFESPPRRRLADSLFASFKLPRKREGGGGGGGMAARPALAQPKRKSAVELLAESKAFYVKSETVRDRKQDIPLRVSSGLSQAIAVGGCHLVSSGTLNNDACCNPYATTGRGLGAARRAVSAGEGLQNTLRRLLEHSDSRENVYSPPVYAVPHKLYSSPRRVTSPYGAAGAPRPGPGPGPGPAGGSGAGAGGLPRPRSFGNARVFFPDSFRPPQPTSVRHDMLSPESFRPHQSAGVRHDMLSPESSPDSINPELSAQHIIIGAISPPAQYAHSAPRYTRSNSHSQPSAREEESGSNINSHKSLPDLHSQARCYPEHVPTASGEPAGRSPRRRRHSAHQRTASCSSKGTRSNHSSLLSSCEAFSEHPSPGDDNYPYNSRCGSSFARDSGGSSGHYTQRSAPPHAPHAPHAPLGQHAPRRNDSGSSTQHERASRYNSYYTDTFGASPEECYVSAPPQFQDGAPSPPPAPPAPPSQRVGIHFQASAPPPQFQDEPGAFEAYEYDAGAYSPPPCAPRKDYGPAREYTRYHEPGTDVVSKQPLYAEPRRARMDDTQDYVNAQQIHGVEEVTSPLGTFKRQRCLRYKQRRPRPIMRSKSDISDRYRRTEGRSPASAPCEGSDSADSLSSESERLRHFFERLGLDARQFEALVTSPQPESPVFFASCSSVDSTQLPDYTVQGPPQKPIYRNTEPPSVVERNARIVKWLCQCRKSALQPQH